MIILSTLPQFMSPESIKIRLGFIEVKDLTQKFPEVLF